MMPVRSQNSCWARKLSELLIMSAAEWRVRKSRWVQAVLASASIAVSAKASVQAFRGLCMKSGNRGRAILPLVDCNQRRRRSRAERAVGNLRVKLARPATGNGSFATWAFAFRTDAICRHKVSVAFDKNMATLVAMGAFEVADGPGQVSGINVMKPGPASNFSGPLQVLGTGIPRARHLVILMERGDMPGNIR